jgi:hypothetical protein
MGGADVKKKARYQYEVNLVLTTRQAYKINVTADGMNAAKRLARNNAGVAKLSGEPSITWSAGDARVVRAFQRLWDTLSDILEEEGTNIPKGLRQAAIDAIEQAKEEKPDEA